MDTLIMGLFRKQAFSKRIILEVYLPTLSVGIVLLILKRMFSKFSLIKIFDGIVQFILNILNTSIPIYILLIFMSAAFIIYKIFNNKFDHRQEFILSLIDSREISLIKIFFAYKKMFPNDSRTMTICFSEMKRLEKRKFIKLGCMTGGINNVNDELFKVTKKGQRKLAKISESMKAQAERIFDEIYRKSHSLDSLIPKVNNEETIKEIVYILGILANQPDKKRLKSLLKNEYFSKYRNKEVSDFNYMWSILEKEQFIFQDHGITGYGEAYTELAFYITNEGLEFYSESKAVVKI